MVQFKQHLSPEYTNITENISDVTKSLYFTLLIQDVRLLLNCSHGWCRTYIWENV